MERQVEEVDTLLANLTSAGLPWAIGGDFNLLPSEQAYRELAASHQSFYNPRTEIAPLYAHYQAIPSYAEATGTEAARWYTYFPNDPAIGRPDRTLDYLFFAQNVQTLKHYVRRNDTLSISDHLPLVAEFRLP